MHKEHENTGSITYRTSALRTSTSSMDSAIDESNTRACLVLVAPWRRAALQEVLRVYRHLRNATYNACNLDSICLCLLVGANDECTSLH
jgi:hypothetical protein